MPTYQYVCTECGGQIEAVQRFTDDPLTNHDACGGRLRKVFSPVGIVFKGSGFYRTDSRNGSSASTPAGSSASGSADSGSGGETKSDSKNGADSSSSSSSDASKASPGSPGSGSAAGSSSGRRSAEKVA